MPDFAFSVEASPMAANDLIPLFFSDRAEEPEQPGIGRAWDRAAISSRILKTSILVIAAAAIVFAILSVGNPIALFVNATASLVATSAPQDTTDQSMPIIQSTAGDQALPPTASEAPTGDEIAAAFKTAYESQTEIREPPAEALFKQFQAWAAEEDARAQVRPVQPVQDAQAQVVQNARAQIGPVQKQRRVRPLHSARADVRPVQNARAKVAKNARAQVRREQDARVRVQVQVRPVQNARAQVLPEQNAQAPWPWLVQSSGWLN
jgi:hypothetical protein